MASLQALDSSIADMLICDGADMVQSSFPKVALQSTGEIFALVPRRLQAALLTRSNDAVMRMPVRALPSANMTLPT